MSILKVNIYYERFKFWISDGFGGVMGEVHLPNAMVRALSSSDITIDELERIKGFHAEVEVFDILGFGTRYFLYVPDNIFEKI